MSSKVIAESVKPGVVARAHLVLIQIAAAFSRSFRLKGLGRFVRFIGQIAPHDDYAVFRLDEGVRLKVFLRDAYWINPLLRDRAYESDISRVLARIDWRDAAFIDCGANIGYWSAVVGAKVRRAKRVIAVEASSVMYEQLLANARLNQGRFHALHAAVWDRSGEMVPFAADEERHSWASADPDIRERLMAVGFQSDPVPSITIDDIVADHIDGDPNLLVIKVDVEGAEIAALRGASRTLSRNTLLIYEDHGRDDASGVTGHVMSHGMSVFHIIEDRLQPIDDLGRLRDLKNDSATAYNFFACPPAAPIHQEMVRLTEEATLGRNV